MSQKSKFLSLVLRHKPEDYNIKIEKRGGFSVSELDEIVSSDNKHRYSFNFDKTKIRANQGHSINVNLCLKIVTPPILLYHGTVEKFLESIKKLGLQKMNRQYVHLSSDIETAKNVGQRKGKPIILQIFARQMVLDGYKFYISDNNIYLTDVVPFKYVKIEKQKYG